MFIVLYRIVSRHKKVIPENDTIVFIACMPQIHDDLLGTVFGAGFQHYFLDLCPWRKVWLFWRTRAIILIEAAVPAPPA